MSRAASNPLLRMFEAGEFSFPTHVQPARTKKGRELSLSALWKNLYEEDQYPVTVKFPLGPQTMRIFRWPIWQENFSVSRIRRVWPPWLPCDPD